MSPSSIDVPSTPVPPAIPFELCPIRASLGVLGRKWALLVLRDIGFFGTIHFNRILKNNPGLVPRTLSLRVRELEAEGFITSHPSETDRREVVYTLTRKGLDVMPILTAFIQFGIRYHADRVFADGQPRPLDRVYPEERPRLLGQLYTYANPGGSLAGRGEPREPKT